MSYLRPTQVITNWIGENSLIESGIASKIILNKVNSVFYTEDDVRLNMYYHKLYQQQLPNKQNQKQKKSSVEMVPLPKEHVPYRPTLLPKAQVSLSQRPLVCMAKGKDIPHSATAPHVDMPDEFPLGP
jgi:hypothetical protein